MMTRFLLLFLLATRSWAAGPVRVAFDAKVVDWNVRCRDAVTNAIYFGGLPDIPPNGTLALIASSMWMGGVRSLGLYPGNIFRANLMCGTSYGGANGCGDRTDRTSIASPQVALIADLGNPWDNCTGTGINSPQAYWKYSETGTNGGLGCLSTSHYTQLDTGIAPSAVSSWINDAHFCGYRIEGDNDGGVILGSTASSTFLVLSRDGSSQPLFYNAAWTASVISSTNSGSTGFFLGSRTSGTLSINWNGSQLGSGAVGGDPANLPSTITVFANHNTGVSPYVFSASKFQSGGYALGRAISNTNTAAAYYNVWQQYETLLGRQK